MQVRNLRKKLFLGHGANHPDNLFEEWQLFEEALRDFDKANCQLPCILPPISLRIEQRVLYQIVCVCTFSICFTKTIVALLIIAIWCMMKSIRRRSIVKLEDHHVLVQLLHHMLINVLRFEWSSDISAAYLVQGRVRVVVFGSEVI